MDKLEEPRHHDPLLGGTEKTEDDQLGYLVKQKNNQHEDPHAAVGSPLHRLKTTLVPARRSCRARLSRRTAMKI